MDIETAGLKPSPIKGIICNHLCRQVELRNLTYAYILVGELSGWTEAQPYFRSPYPASRAQAASLAMTGITEEPDLRLKRRYNTLRELYSQKDSYDQETKAIPADTV